MHHLCKICKKILTGRSDKVFCSINCKNYYHVNLRSATKLSAHRIDEFLHRNRSILLELMGKHKVQLKVTRKILEEKKFRFRYHTHYHINKKGKMYHYLYDLAWMEFSDDEVLIIRKR